MKKFDYKNTISACFIAYTVQAIVCNFAPLLFVGWSKEFNISIPQLTSIITLTFFTQIVVDLIAARYADKAGYKLCLVIAHIASGAGFIMLGTLPYLFKNSYALIVVSVIIYSVGSGLLEVLISPVVESCPTKNKAGAMSLLHSFYCWGTVGVIAVSTLFFAIFGRDNWRYLSFIWAVFSLLNGIYFIFVPVSEIKSKDHSRKKEPLFKNKLFIISIIIMICAGASELAMSQWASTFAELGLNVSKAVGDLAGPMAFAVLMGFGRILFSKLSNKIAIEKYITASAVLCIASYLSASLFKNPIMSLMGCAVCGFAVSAMWPATISLTTKSIPNATTAMFAFLAVAGDVGCTAGPSLIGYITNALGGELKKGLIFACIFPVIIICCLLSRANKQTQPTVAQK